VLSYRYVWPVPVVFLAVSTYETQVLSVQPLGDGV
jgi:hypothetical protein